MVEERRPSEARARGVGARLIASLVRACCGFTKKVSVREPPPRATTRHQPKKRTGKSRRGEGGRVAWGGPFWSPAVPGGHAGTRWWRVRRGRGGRPERHSPPIHTPLAPTYHPASCLTSWLRLMPIGDPCGRPDGDP